mgnify:CR=1 FL=1
MRKHSRKPFFAALAVALFAICAMPIASLAQQQLISIAILVNDEVISEFDVQQRMRWQAQRGRAPRNQQELNRLRAASQRALVDEMLLVQDVKQRNFEITEEMIDQQFQGFAQSQNMSVPALVDALRQRGIEVSTVRRQMEARIATDIIIQGRLRGQVTVSEEDIDERLATLASAEGQFRYLVSEIILNRDNGETDVQFEDRAFRVASTATSAQQFIEIARNVSTGPTARNGGLVGWVNAGQLSPALDNVVTTLKDGQISQPIRTSDSTFTIIRLTQRAKTFSQDHSNTQVQLSQMLIPLGKNASATDVQQAQARTLQIASEISDCAGLNQISERHAGTQAADLGLLTISELPGPIRQAVEELNKGQISQPVRTAAGLNLFVMCARSKPVEAGPSRERVQRELTENKIRRRLDTYIKDLRRNATIERR